MIEKCRYCYVLDNGEPTFYDLNKKDTLQMYQVENLLNSLSEENEQLKQKKERYKRLSEIREENINNRILSIKEFINNCEDEKVKNTLEDLFYSEVKEYDLAKENRELKKENEQFREAFKDRYGDIND